MSSAPKAAVPDAERGNVLALTMGSFAVAIALVLTIGSVATLHLERKALLALADAAAADAAAALVEESYYAGGSSVADEVVRESVTAFLAAAPDPVTRRHEALRIAAPTDSPEAGTAQVSLAALVRPPFIPWPLIPWSEGIEVVVTASAHAGG